MFLRKLTTPPLSFEHLDPALKALLMNSDRSPDNSKKNVIKESLKSWNVCVIDGQQLREGISADNAKCHNLSTFPELILED
jgi:hypothetical protein